jgi:hypothetical protein
MGRRIETTLLKKIIQYRIQWEMNEMDNHLNKTMINVIKEPSEARGGRGELQKDILEEIAKKFMEKRINMVKKNVQDTLKKF